VRNVENTLAMPLKVRKSFSIVSAFIFAACAHQIERDPSGTARINACSEYSDRLLLITRDGVPVSRDNGEFVAHQSYQRKRYLNLFAPQVKAERSPYHTLPKNLTPELAKGYEAIFKAVKSEQIYFDLLQEFERSVFNRWTQSSLSLEEAFLRTLSDLERRYGFQAPVVVQSFLPNHELLALMHKGHPIEDLFFLGKAHGARTHRLQHVLLAGYVEREFGDSALYVKIYQDMGDPLRGRSLSWAGTGLDPSRLGPVGDPEYVDLHAFLFDTPFFSRTLGIRPTDFTNPEVFHDLKNFTPYLVPGWK
jgi:hypothetical protein